MATPRNEESDTRRGEPEPEPFETAQHRLFEAYGLEARSRFVEVDEPPVRTHVLEAGPDLVAAPPDGDTPLVFVHSTGSFGGFLTPLMAAFDDARMVAFDRPGYGLSDPFVYTEENLRRTVVDALAGVLDALGLDRVDLVGHSMGGHAAVLFALASPERVRRLFLVGAVPAFPGTRPPLPLRLTTVPGLGRLLRWLQTSGEEGVLDVAELFGEREAIQDHPEFVRALAAHEADPKAAEAGASEFRALFSVRGWHPSVRLGEAELRGLRQPTTVVWGDHDPLGVPDDVRDAVALIPDVQFEAVDAGHFPFLSHAGRCAALIREARSAGGFPAE